MKRLMISAAAAITMLVAATTALRSHVHSDAGPELIAMMPLRDLHRAAAMTYLPSQDFEDMSLIYPTTPRR